MIYFKVLAVIPELKHWMTVTNKSDFSDNGSKNLE